MLQNRGLEAIILGAVLLLLFGAKRLPDAARALGKSLRILKSEVVAMKSDEPAEAASEPTMPPSPVETILAAPGQSANVHPLADPQQRCTAAA